MTREERDRRGAGAWEAAVLRDDSGRPLRLRKTAAEALGALLSSIWGAFERVAGAGAEFRWGAPPGPRREEGAPPPGI
jgi:hypothetical protein